ncbi:hypothetical protein DICVIV_05483 [Dictyocaulus viviparus]|uniref:Secreted protein n=1 Tax=Dictyocaulus viviparus TaxID=29172 RepID=A0A0D8XV02_DICVI|nr:hypothetical protein DICVIV_05483 [Dictyocaulus viviparus]
MYSVLLSSLLLRLLMTISAVHGLVCLTCVQSSGTTQLDNFRVSTRLPAPTCRMEPIRCDRDQDVCVRISMHIGTKYILFQYHESSKYSDVCPFLLMNKKNPTSSRPRVQLCRPEILSMSLKLVLLIIVTGESDKYIKCRSNYNEKQIRIIVEAVNVEENRRYSIVRHNS